MIKLRKKRILSEGKTQDQPNCHFREKDAYPVEGSCLEKKLVYQCNLKMTESIIMVLQKIHLKTDFANTAMPSSARVRQVPGNYQSISEK